MGWAIIPIYPLQPRPSGLRPPDGPTFAPGARPRREPHRGRFDAHVHRSAGESAGDGRVFFKGLQGQKGRFIGKRLENHGKMEKLCEYHWKMMEHVGKWMGTYRKIHHYHVSKMGTLAIEKQWACLRNLCERPEIESNYFLVIKFGNGIHRFHIPMRRSSIFHIHIPYMIFPRCTMPLDHPKNGGQRQGACETSDVTIK